MLGFLTSFLLSGFTRAFAASGVAPLTFPAVAGLAKLHEGDGITGYLDGDPINEVPDLSGNGRHEVQVTMSCKPTYVAAGANGLPAWRYDGVDDFTIMDVEVTLGDFQIFVVLKQYSGANDGLFSSLIAVPYFGLNHYEQGRLSYWNGDQEVWIPTPSDLSVPCLITWTRFGGEARIRLNGAELGFAEDPVPANINPKGLMGPSAGPTPDVEISAFVVIDSAVSAVAEIEHYLDQKYFNGGLGL